MWSEVVPFLLALAGRCTVLSASLHHGVQTSPTIISSGWVFPTVPKLIASMNSSSYVGAPLVLHVVQAVATVVTLGWISWRAISSWGLWSSPISLVSVLPPLPGWQLWLLGGHLDFSCCDPVGVHSLIEVHSSAEVACHCGISVPIVQPCCIWNNMNSMWGSLFCWVGAVMYNWGSPWKVQVECDHYHCNWCWLLAACHGRLHPQVWSCGKLVLRHSEWWSGSQQCQLAHWKVSWMDLP